MLKKKQPIIALESLLKRRKTNLSKYLKDSGINTYELLIERCHSMGVKPPEPHIFQQALPEQQVSSPTEGVVVLPPFEVINDSGTKIVIEEVAPEIKIITDDPMTEEETEKKKKRKVQT